MILYPAIDLKDGQCVRLLRGDMVTATVFGSDPAAMQTTAVLSEDGTHYVLNGEKLWCTNGTIAELMVVMAHDLIK